MYLISDFDKQEKDYSWIAPTVLGIGTAAAIGVGLAAGHKGLAAKTAKKEAATATKKSASTVKKTTKTTKVTQAAAPLKSASPTYKSQATALPSGLSKDQKALQIIKRVKKLRGNADAKEEIIDYTNIFGDKKRTKIDARDKLRRTQAVDSVIKNNNGDYSAVCLLIDFISEP